MLSLNLTEIFLFIYHIVLQANGSDWTVWAIPLLSTALGVAGGFGGAMLTSAGSFRKDYLSRLEKAERKASKYENRVISLKRLMTSLLLEHEIVLSELPPEATKKIDEIRARMRVRGGKDPLLQFREILEQDDAQDQEDEDNKE